MNECRLPDRDGEWYFHIVATRSVEERGTSSVETPIGVDIGEVSLLMVCHRGERGSPTAPNLWNSEDIRVQQLREAYFTAARRLQKRGNERIIESYDDELWRHIDRILHAVTLEVVSYADRFENPMLVLEDLTHIHENMDYSVFVNQRLHRWGFAEMHAQIRYKASGKGTRAETVNPAYASETCHCCGEAGCHPEQVTFECSNSACRVSEHQADVNAALNITDHYLNGGSHSREHTDGNDSAEEEERLTVPQGNQADADTQQETLGAYAS